MAEIRPFKAWKYNPMLTEKIEQLTSPLFDVISDKKREALYLEPYNSVHLSVPRGESPHIDAAETLKKWKAEGILLQDEKPGIYVYYQYFTLPGSKKEYCRKGFIAMIRAYSWDENVILRHENTIPGAVNDRIALLESTEMHVSPTHGLYTDEYHTLDRWMDESMQNPLFETEDYQGVRDVLAKIEDPEKISIFLKVLENKQIILADGHHRYESSIVYRQNRQKSNPNHVGNEAYNYHLMYLTNTESDDLRILPTHRLISNYPDVDPEKIIKRASNWFHIKEIEDIDSLQEVLVGKKWAFGLAFRDRAVKIRLKEEVIHQMEWPFPKQVKELDLTVLHYFFIEKVLGISGKDQRTYPGLSFERNFTTCISRLIQGKADMALITQEINMEEIKQVCYSGFTLPQKSTYFYPKAIAGFIFASIKQEEF